MRRARIPASLIVVTLCVLLLPAFVLAQGHLAWPRINADGEGGEYGGGYPFVLSADLDNDGDGDLLGFATYDTGSKWWRNLDGDGTEWEEHGLLSGYSPLTACDMDGDGDLDLFGASYLGGYLYLWENLGDGVFDDITPINTDFVHPKGLSHGDLDGDGDQDLLAGIYNGEDIVWVENLAGDGSQWQVHTVYHSEEYDGNFRPSAADMDGDGDLDILAPCFGYTGTIQWFENIEGDGSFWIPTIITDAYGAWDAKAADFDGDGDLDVVGAHDYTHPVLYFNDSGDGSSWTPVELVIDYNYQWIDLHDIDAGDYDNDGDPDILIPGGHINDMIVMENASGDGEVWYQHTVDNDYEEPWSGVFADINGDGTQDVVGAAHDDGYISVWIQPSQQTITVAPTSPTVLPAAGGTISFSVHVTNSSGQTFPGLTFWTEVQLPSLDSTEPLFSYPFTLQPGMDFSYGGLSQVVPSFAPSGDYVFVGHMGLMGDQWLADTFTFTKLPPAGEVEGTTDGAVDTDVPASSLNPASWPTLVQGDQSALSK